MSKFLLELPKGLRKQIKIVAGIKEKTMNDFIVETMKNKIESKYKKIWE
jgi:hypothetical protein